MPFECHKSWEHMKFTLRRTDWWMGCWCLRFLSLAKIHDGWERTWYLCKLIRVSTSPEEISGWWFVDYKHGSTINLRD
jgi:hypothetical protein